MKATDEEIRYNCEAICQTWIDNNRKKIVDDTKLFLVINDSNKIEVDESSIGDELYKIITEKKGTKVSFKIDDVEFGKFDIN